MKDWFDRFARWWKQGNAIGMVTGERGLDEVQDGQLPQPGSKHPEAGSGESSVIEVRGSATTNPMSTTDDDD